MARTSAGIRNQVAVRACQQPRGTIAGGTLALATLRAAGSVHRQGARVGAPLCNQTVREQLVYASDARWRGTGLRRAQLLAPGSG